MHLNTFNEFRHAIYACFQRSADVSFEITDALLTETGYPLGVAPYGKVAFTLFQTVVDEFVSDSARKYGRAA